MFKKLYYWFLSKKTFNPYKLISVDHDTKLKGLIKDKEVLILLSKTEDWNIQILSCNKQTDFNEYNYVDHLTFNGKPNRFQLLNSANYLITKNFHNEKTT